MKQTTLICLLVSLFAGLQAGAQTSIALTNAHVYPVSGAPIEHATILMKDGKIVSVGVNVAVPAGAQRIDLHGATVIPGLVDVSSALFLPDESLTGAGTADQDVLDGLDLFDKDAAKVLAAGVTTLYLSPGDRGTIGGVGAIVKLQDPNHSMAATGTAMQANTLKPHAGLQITLGLSPSGRSTSLERLNSYQALRSAFIATRQYGLTFDHYVRDLALYEKRQKAGGATPPTAGAVADGPESIVPEEADEDDTTTDPNEPQRGGQRGGGAQGGQRFGGGGQGFGPGRPNASGKPTKPRAVPAQEIMLAALKGQIPVRIEAHRSDDIMHALALADEFKLKLILESPTEAAPVAAEIAKRHIPVIWGSVLTTGAPHLETAHQNPTTPALLAKAGVTVALTTGTRSGQASRFLRENAALAAGFGLSSAAALRSITLSAAEVLGISDRVGSIQAGKDADLVILSASPWDPAAKVERVFINGAQVYSGH
ncbi:MAG: amidohydrolase [Chthonomonadales bacterium]|nr:amidohydrolase [Chthonomonadales bacterium]